MATEELLTPKSVLCSFNLKECTPSTDDEVAASADGGGTDDEDEEGEAEADDDDDDDDKEDDAADDVDDDRSTMTDRVLEINGAPVSLLSTQRSMVPSLSPTLSTGSAIWLSDSETPQVCTMHSETGGEGRGRGAQQG